MTPNRYRMVMAGLGLLLGAVVVAAVLLVPSGRGERLPAGLDGYAPAAGDQVSRQVVIEVDLRPGYELTLTVDDVPVPSSEIEVVPQTGRHRWSPAPGRSIEAWTPGLHTVEATWDRSAGLPDRGTLRWTFRVIG